MKNVKRVCIFCENWESGGIEAFLTNVIRAMDPAGLKIDIVCAKLGRSIFTAQLMERNVGFYQLSGSVRRVGENWRLLQKFLKKRQYDVLYVNAYQSLSLGCLRLAEESGISVRIAHSHNTALRKSLTQPLKLVLHCWARKNYSDVMTCRWACSKAAAKFLFGETDDWHFIPNGIDVSRFRFDPEEREKSRKELGLDGKMAIGNIGRLCYQKNQEFLLDVFREVLVLCPESALLLVGEGEDRPKLLEKAKALGVKDSVIFCGATDKVERLYWAMDVFVFPSRFEGLGIAAVEAQAAGLPVICSEHIPREAWVTDQVTQLSLSVGSNAWAEAIRKAKAPPDRTAAAEMVSAAGYEIKTVAKKLKEAWVG